MTCCPISSRLITIRLRDSPFNITIIQAHAPASNYNDDDIEYFYEELQKVLEETPKTDILVVRGDWKPTIGEEACKDWKGTCGHHCNTKSNDGGRRLLQFAGYNDLVVANTFGPHKTSKKITWHSPDGKTHTQIDYIMVEKRFKTRVNIAQTRSFPGADIGSEHELVIMTFKLHMKRAKKQRNTRIRFHLEKLKDHAVAEIFQAKIGGKFAALSILDSDTDMDMLTDTFNTAVTDTANEILGKYRAVKKPWVTTDILDLCAKRRKLKNKKDNKDRGGMVQYRAVN